MTTHMGATAVESDHRYNRNQRWSDKLDEWQTYQNSSSFSGCEVQRVTRGLCYCFDVKMPSSSKVTRHCRSIQATLAGVIVYDRLLCCLLKMCLFSKEFHEHTTFKNSFFFFSLAKMWTEQVINIHLIYWSSIPVSQLQREQKFKQWYQYWCCHCCYCDVDRKTVLLYGELVGEQGTAAACGSWLLDQGGRWHSFAVLQRRSVTTVLWDKNQ